MLRENTTPICVQCYNMSTKVLLSRLSCLTLIFNEQSQNENPAWEKRVQVCYFWLFMYHFFKKDWQKPAAVCLSLDEVSQPTWVQIQPGIELCAATLPIHIALSPSEKWHKHFHTVALFILLKLASCNLVEKVLNLDMNFRVPLIGALGIEPGALKHMCWPGA